MLRILSDFVFGKDLKSDLSKTKKVRIAGYKFVLRRVSPLDHLAGSKVLLASYEVAKVGNAPALEKSEKKIKEHLSEVLLAGVVSPRLTANEEPDGIHIDKLFVDAELVNKIYAEIISFTYGKKKSLLRRSAEAASKK